MDSKSYQELQSHFLRLRQIDSKADRADALNAIGDPTVRQELEALLAADSECDGFLEHGTDPPESSPLDRTGADMGRANRDYEARYPGRIGEYRLLQKVGEGGYGAVFMAEQRGVIDRKVAIKLIKPGMDSRQVLSRFFAERQALAMMDHLSIARVYDAGETEDGHPYFVMELVNGVPIHEFCESNELPLVERIRLFTQVCSAVQHAHQKGVIHRDLKPSNILVTMTEDAPLAKVIDFGIAKALDTRLTNATLYTEYGQMLGTLEYMSPEQAEMSSVDIDVRSDIYSLGVVLYQLLTGETPISKDVLLRDGLLEIHRRLKDTNPPTPSARITASRKKDAKIRPGNDGGISGLVKSDLDWITMKAIAKDRRLRYDSAKEFSADLTRFLDGAPVEAHPPSILYRASRRIRRHWLATLSTALILLSLAIGLVGTLYGLRLTQVARDEARQAAADSEQANAELAERTIELSRQLYLQNLNASFQAISQHDPARADQLLKSSPNELRGWEWEFVAQQVDEGDASVVRAVDPLVITDFQLNEPQGWMACVTNRGSVEIRALDSNRLKRTLDTQAIVSCCCITPDGLRLVVGTRFGAIQIWDPATGAMERETQVAIGAIYDLNMNERGDRIAFCSGSGQVAVLALDGLDELNRWKLPSRLSELRFDSNDQFVIGSGLDGKLYQLEIDDGGVRSVFVSAGSLNRFEVADDAIWILAGNRLVQCSADITEETEVEDSGDRATIRLVHRFEGNVSTMTRVDGGVVAGVRDGRLMLVETPDGPTEEIARFASGIVKIQWAPQREELLVALTDGRMVWRGPFGEAADVVEVEPTESVTGGQLLVSRELLATLHDNGQLRLYRCDDGSLIKQVEAHDGSGWSLGIDRKEELVATLGEDRFLRLWTLPELNLISERKVDWGVRMVAVSANGSFVATASVPKDPPGQQEGIVTLWSLPDLEPQRVLAGHRNWVTGMALSPDDKTLVTSCEDRRVVVWSIEEGRLLHEFSSPSLDVARSLCIDAQRDQLFIGHENGEVTVWDLTEGGEVASWACFGDAVNHVSVTSDRRVLTTSRSDRRLRIWHADTRRELASLDLGIGYIKGLVASPSGPFAVANSGDGLKFFWRSLPVGK